MKVKKYQLVFWPLFIGFAFYCLAGKGTHSRLELLDTLALSGLVALSVFLGLLLLARVKRERS
jgi:hypothetical protein